MFKFFDQEKSDKELELERELRLLDLQFKIEQRKKAIEVLTKRGQDDETVTIEDYRISNI